MGGWSMLIATLTSPTRCLSISIWGTIEKDFLILFTSTLRREIVKKATRTALFLLITFFYFYFNGNIMTSST